MAKIDIFKESIIVDSFTDSNLEDRIKKNLQEEKKKNEGNQISNVNGFQSKNIVDKILAESILMKTHQLINNFININPIYKLRLLNMWINENYKNSFNVIHTHPRSNFSGIYYVEVPEDSGKLVFLKNDASGSMLIESDMFPNNDLNYNLTYSLQPLKNQIIIFPSHLKHMVLSNNNKESRISLAFNLDLIKEDG